MKIVSEIISAEWCEEEAVRLIKEAQGQRGEAGYHAVLLQAQQLLVLARLHSGIDVVPKKKLKLEGPVQAPLKEH